MSVKITVVEEVSQHFWKNLELIQEAYRERLIKIRANATATAVLPYREPLTHVGPVKSGTMREFEEPKT